MGGIQATIFDLFGTLVDFEFARLSVREIHGHRVPVTIDSLDELLVSLRPTRPSVEEFYAALRRVSLEITEEISESQVEVPSVIRFSRALANLGVEDAEDALAHEFVTRHMAGLASAVVCPPGRRRFLAELASRCRVGLVSNFDHAPTARAILDREGLHEFLEVVVISDEAGTRKPGRRIFDLACDGLGLPSQACVFVGDSYEADVVGAFEAGLTPIWLTKEKVDEGLHATSIESLEDLPAVLSERFGVE